MVTDATDGRIDRIEADHRHVIELLRRAAEGVAGVQENQRILAANQALLIEALGRMAERLGTAPDPPGRERAEEWAG